MKVQFTQPEIEIILDWFKTATSSSEKHLGSLEVLFPTELLLLEKLSQKPEMIELSESELELIYEIMQKTVYRKYGGATYLFGFEQQIYQKIKKVFKNEDSSQ